MSQSGLFSGAVVVFAFIANVAISHGYIYSRVCQPSTSLVRTVFIATFGISGMILELCLWEIHGSLKSEIRGIAWKLVVGTVLADLVVIIPLLLSYSTFIGYVPRRASRWYKLLLPTLPFIVFLYLFWQMGALLPIPEKKGVFWRVESRSLMEECVLRIGGMGVTISAILSGFGSICAGWETYFTPHKHVTEADVLRSKASIEMTLDLINQKRRKIEQLEEQIYKKSQESQSFVNRVVNTVRGSAEQQKVKALQAELKGLSQMHTSLQSQHSSLQTIYVRESQRNTFRGFLALVARHLFALYCIYRILSTGWSNLCSLLGRPRHTVDEDPISRILALVTKAWISTTKSPLDTEAYRHLIGFILVGVVIAGSINAVMSTIQRLSKSAPVGPATETLYISWLSGVYFMSTAVMLRCNLPEKYVGGIGNALGSSLKQGIFEGWFDIVFFVVAGVTGVGLLLTRMEEDNVQFEGKEV